MTTASSLDLADLQWDFDEIDRVEQADRPWHSMGFQAKVAGGLGLFYSVGGLGFLLLDNGIGENGAIFSFCIAGFLLLIAGTLALLAWHWGRKLRHMMDGHTDADWRIDDTQWQAHLYAEVAAHRWLFWGGLAFVLFFSACLGLGFSTRDDLANPYFGATSIGLLHGLGTALYLGVMIAVFQGSRRYLMNQKRQRSRRVLIGETGFYLGGAYWPWATFGQRVLRGKLECEPADDKTPAAAFPRIVFTVELDGKNGSTEKPVPVPVPHDRIEEALEALRLNGM
jgi:hypothetical protein